MFALKMKTPIRPVYLWDRTAFLRKNYMIVGDEFGLDEFYDMPLTKEVLAMATDKIYQKMDEELD